jgi:hypothetical protein
MPFPPGDLAPCCWYVSLPGHSSHASGLYAGLSADAFSIDGTNLMVIYENFCA